MTTSGTADRAIRLLGAFYDLSGGNPNAPVSIGGSGAPDEEGAATRAGLGTLPVERDVAVRYLLNKSYLKPAETASTYTITVQGIERARAERGMENKLAFYEGSSGMSDTAQRRLLTVLSIVIAMGLSRPISNFIEEAIPERRGIKDDLLEAALQGVVRTASLFLASLLVRRLAGR